MIRVLVYLGDNDERQLAEMKITWLEHLPLGWAKYSAEIAVDSGEDMVMVARQFEHQREQKNVLSLIESALLQLEDEHFKLTGKMDKHPKKYGAFRELTDIVKHLTRGEDE